VTEKRRPVDSRQWAVDRRTVLTKQNEFGEMKRKKLLDPGSPYLVRGRQVRDDGKRRLRRKDYWIPDPRIWYGAGKSGMTIRSRGDS